MRMVCWEPEKKQRMKVAIEKQAKDGLYPELCTRPLELGMSDPVEI